MKRKKIKASAEIEEMFATGDASEEPAKNERAEEQAVAGAEPESGEPAAREESEDAAEVDTETERAAAGEDLAFADNPAPDADASGSDSGDAAQMDEPPEQDAAPDATAEEPSSNRRFSDVLLEGAARIENAKRTGDRLAEAVGDFCRKALTKPDKLVGTANAFLIEGFRDDLSRIARAVPEEFVLAAVERGHVELAGALVNHWAAADDRVLSGVVDRVIASPDRFARAELAGFLAGLARATGVMKPVRASELVALASRVGGEDSRADCEEARKIVAAGEFLRQNAPEHRSFWKQRFTVTGGDWGGAEAANAIAKLHSCVGRGVAIPAMMLEALPPEEAEALAPASPKKTSPPARKPDKAEKVKKPEVKEPPPDEEAPTLLPVRKAASDIPDFQNLRPVIRPPSRNPARFVIAVGIAAAVLLIWVLWPGAKPALDAPGPSSMATPSTSPSPAVPAVPAPASVASTAPAPAALPAPAPAAKSEPPPPSAQASPATPAPAPPASAMRTPSEVAEAKAAPAATPPPPAPAVPAAPSAPAAQSGAGLPQWRRDRMAEEIRKQPEVERWYRSVKAGTWESSRKLLAGDVSFLPFQSDAHRGLVTLCTLDPPENAETRRALPRMAILTFPVADLVPLWEQIVADNGRDAPEVRNAAGLLVDVDQRSMPPHLAARLKKIAGREK